MSEIEQIEHQRAYSHTRHPLITVDGRPTRQVSRQTVKTVVLFSPSACRLCLPGRTFPLPHLLCFAPNRAATHPTCHILPLGSITAHPCHCIRCVCMVQSCSQLAISAFLPIRVRVHIRPCYSSNKPEATDLHRTPRHNSPLLILHNPTTYLSASLFRLHSLTMISGTL